MGKPILTASDSELREMYESQRMTMKQIAEKYGCSAPAVCLRMKKAGIAAREPHDYETTQKQRDAWVKIGKAGKGRSLSEKQKKALSEANRGRRKRNDYEFGGHEKQRSDGYVKVYMPDHPHCTKDGYVMKHILVMEREIGRYIEPGEVVHHINHVRNDNRIENLRLMTAHDHMSMHMKERWEQRRANNVK